jgi:hypothetical protein
MASRCIVPRGAAREKGLLISPDGPRNAARGRESDRKMTSATALIAFAVKASVFLNVLALGMRAGAAGPSVFAMNVLMPLFAVALAFDLEPVVKIALMALAVSPVPPMLPHRASRNR